LADRRRETGRRSRQSQRGGRRFTPRRKRCGLCIDGVDVVDYKQVEFLRSFLTTHGKIRPPHKTGTCAKHQRRLAVAIKRARYLALLPYTAEHIRRHL
jgi:small subunit ribosomal protein S18